MIDTYTDPQPDSISEPLWMVTRPRVGDVAVRWEDLTLAEQLDAHQHHKKLYGIEI